MFAEARVRARPWIRPLAILIGFASLVVVFGLAVGTGPTDYTDYIRRPAANWLAGNSQLYDAAGEGFYFPPWALLLLIPSVLLPPAYGQAFVNAISMIGLLFALARFGKGLPWWVWALSATPFFWFMGMVRGNFDGVALLGLVVSWWAATERRPWALAAGLWLLSLKPIHAAPVLLFLTALTWHWSWKEKLTGLSLLLVSVPLSFVLVGADWPQRYLEFVLGQPPRAYLVVNLWKAGRVLGVAFPVTLAVGGLVVAGSAAGIRRLGLTPEGFALAMTGWMLVAPYAQEIHYAVLTPAFLTVARRYRPVAVGAYLASYTPLLRIPFGYGINLLDLIYPAVLWVGALIVAYGWAPQPLGEPRRTAKSPPVLGPHK